MGLACGTVHHILVLKTCVVCDCLFAVAHQKLHVLELHDGTDTLNVENYGTCCW